MILPIPPVWFWLIVLSVITVYIYISKVLLKAEKENYGTPTAEERLKWEITKMKCFEIIAWIFLSVGCAINAYGILYLSPFVIFGAGCLIIGSCLVAVHYRKRRFKHQEELKE